MITQTLHHFHFCCGLGGGAKGFDRARPVAVGLSVAEVPQA